MSRRHAYRRQNPRRRSTRGLVRWGVVIFLIVVAAVIYFVSRPAASAPMTPLATATAAEIGLPAEISVEEAYLKYQQGAFFLDVRTQEEWDQFHIPNTTLIPLDELTTRLNELPQDRVIVVVCRSGNRSQQGRDILLQTGFSNVTSMIGGVAQWSALNYPIEGTRP
jgi:phage shock protein E